MLAELWRNLFPWDDLNAKGPPERWLKLGLEILPSLAVLVAQNPAKPKLLTADAVGQLLTSSNIAPNVQAVVASAAGQNVVLLPDTSFFHPGDVVTVTSGLVTGANGNSTITQVQSVQPGSITLKTNLLNACNIGDVVTRIGPVAAPSRKRAWDWQTTTATTNGISYQVVIAAVTGLRHILNHHNGAIINTGGAGATGMTMSVRDNNSVGPILWENFTGITATTGDKDRVLQHDLAVFGVLSHSFVIQGETNQANTSTSISVGGYDSVAEPT